MSEKRWLIIEDAETKAPVAERLIPDGFIGERNLDQMMKTFNFVIEERTCRSVDGKYRYYFKVEHWWGKE